MNPSNFLFMVILRLFQRLLGHLHRSRRALECRDHARKGVGSNGGRPRRSYPVNKYFENGTFVSTETLFCRLNRQALLEVVLDKVEQGRVPPPPPPPPACEPIVPVVLESRG